MTPNQARVIADKLIAEAQKMGRRRSLDSPKEQFYSEGAAIDILLALSAAFDSISLSAPQQDHPHATQHQPASAE